MWKSESSVHHHIDESISVQKLCDAILFDVGTHCQLAGDDTPHEDIPQDSSVETTNQSPFPWYGEGSEKLGPQLTAKPDPTV